MSTYFIIESMNFTYSICKNIYVMYEHINHVWNSFMFEHTPHNFPIHFKFEKPFMFGDSYIFWIYLMGDDFISDV